jgi:hypothetical protein
VNVFQEDVLDDLPNIRDAVNSGARNFSTVVRLVEKTEKTATNIYASPICEK